MKKKDMEWKSSQFHISAEMNALVLSRKYTKVTLFQVLSTVFGYSKEVIRLYSILNGFN